MSVGYQHQNNTSSLDLMCIANLIPKGISVMCIQEPVDTTIARRTIRQHLQAILPHSEENTKIIEDLQGITGEALLNACLHRLDDTVARVAFGINDDRCFVVEIINACNGINDEEMAFDPCIVNREGRSNNRGIIIDGGLRQELEQMLDDRFSCYCTHPVKGEDNGYFQYGWKLKLN